MIGQNFKNPSVKHETDKNTLYLHSLTDTHLLTHFLTHSLPTFNLSIFLSPHPQVSFYLASTVPFIKGFKSVTWNFTEASHRKGAPDGVGGALKNLADRLVAYGTDIPDAEALLYNLSKQSSVKLFKVTEEDIETCGELVPPSLKTVQGTLKVHQVRCHSVNNQIKTIPIMFTE